MNKKTNKMPKTQENSNFLFSFDFRGKKPGSGSGIKNSESGIRIQIHIKPYVDPKHWYKHWFTSKLGEYPFAVIFQ